MGVQSLTIVLFLVIYLISLKNRVTSQCLIVFWVQIPFKGLGEKSYVSYRLQNVSDFKDSGRRDIERMYEEGVYFIINSLSKAVQEQVLPHYKQELKQVVEIFEERMKATEAELQSLEKQKSLLLDKKESLINIIDLPTTVLI